MWKKGVGVFDIKCHNIVKGRVNKLFNKKFMAKFTALDWTAMIILVVGGLNWGLVGLFDYDLVASLFGAGTLLAKIVYDLVGLSAIYVLVTSGKMKNSSVA